MLGADGSDASTADATPDAVSDAGEDAAPARERTVLSAENLYTDFTARTIDPELIEFEPLYPLWTDGTLKRRWLHLPDGRAVDTTNMDDWMFPVGAQVWKEFRTTDGTLLETRLIEREGEDEYAYGTFIWRDDQSDADWSTVGAVDVAGTEHDVPKKTQCITCHLGEPGKILGFSAIQLSHAKANNLITLGAEGVLAPAPTRRYAIPGDATSREALGMLHANCGHCHVPSGSAAFQFPAGAELWMSLTVAETDGPVTDTRLYRTTVGQPLHMYEPPEGVTLGGRVVASDPMSSALWYRMQQRGRDHMPVMSQMPPLATEEVDTVGSAQLADWITALP